VRGFVCGEEVGVLTFNQRRKLFAVIRQVVEQLAQPLRPGGVGASRPPPQCLDMHLQCMRQPPLLLIVSEDDREKLAPGSGFFAHTL
jgi:hypothetical protein